MWCNQCTNVEKEQASLRKKETADRAYFKSLAQEKSLLCQDCGKSFNQESSLNRHILSLHSGVKRNCPQCNKELMGTYSLNSHIQKGDIWLI